MANGEVWAGGAGVLGQLGAGTRRKAAAPIRVALTDHVTHIAVGYFHNCALTSKGEVYTWGGSPQQVRAAAARREQTNAADNEPHLSPRLVDTCNVRGNIVQIAAGWHHSCLVTADGTLYSWGLNFDGQLGSGDRKQIYIPTEVKIRTDTQREPDKSVPKTPQAETKHVKTKALVACGGGFTVFIDNDGRIFITGNNHLQDNAEKDKTSNRIIMMKTTKRIIKIPTTRSINKFVYHDRIDIMFPFEIEDLQRKRLEPRLNPLTSMRDFKTKTWADEVIMILKPWIDEKILLNNPNMAAKLAFHNGLYSECLKYLLDNLKQKPPVDAVYTTHCSITDNKTVTTGDNKIAINSTISKRIKEVSLAILNEKPYPQIDINTYKGLPCCCNELEYIKIKTPNSIKIPDCDIATKAAEIIDRSMTMFPIDSELWETCFRLSKNFYLDNDLCISGLERILFKYMESNAKTMAAAIMFSSDCAHYCQILSPKLYLNMCSQVMDTWG